ncbi:hypothetical protein TTHT_2073 [Thermotomaculum hydrothermale]|uniref:DUF4097 domain-containing protein n=1 Tax=Thermotomaculum hydrothermale TaxID=981385 RepID=A0A7R6T0A3_9BACT|nr:DUF4097 family beta strand repeat-containing protein [Thermotomaculum hydrothermale]BBB33512.1 hypothetical protein TTHT_2073 [Thermotomaculum hydrothermale]
MRRFLIAFLILIFAGVVFAASSNTNNCDGLDKKRFRIDQENIIDIVKPSNIYIRVSDLIDRVEIKPSKDKTMDVKVDIRLRLKTNINNFTVDVKKKGDNIIVETNEYPKELRLKYCDKTGKSVIYITLPQKNVNNIEFKGLNTQLNANGVVAKKFKVKSKFKEVILSDCKLNNLAIKIYNANISLNNVSADKFAIYGGFGNVYLKETNFGSVYVTLLSGNIESFGKISLKSGEISTTFGDIVLDLNKLANLYFKTTSGDINLGLTNPEKTSFKAKTVFGDYIFNFKHSENFKPEGKEFNFGNDSMPKVKIDTNSGDIEIRKIK